MKARASQQGWGRGRDRGRHPDMKVWRCPRPDTRCSACRKGENGTKRSFLVTDEGPKGGDSSAGHGPGRRGRAVQPRRGSTDLQEEGSDARAAHPAGLRPWGPEERVGTPPRAQSRCVRPIPRPWRTAPLSSPMCTPNCPGPMGQAGDNTAAASRAGPDGPEPRSSLGAGRHSSLSSASPADRAVCAERGGDDAVDLGRGLARPAPSRTLSPQRLCDSLGGAGGRAGARPQRWVPTGPVEGTHAGSGSVEGSSRAQAPALLPASRWQLRPKRRRVRPSRSRHDRRPVRTPSWLMAQAMFSCVVSWLFPNRNRDLRGERTLRSKRRLKGGAGIVTTLRSHNADAPSTDSTGGH